MDQTARKWENPGLQPLRVMQFAGGIGAVTLIACLILWLMRTLGWTQQDPSPFIWMGGWFAAALAGMAAWLQWGIYRRKSSDGALFGRHSRIGTTSINDAYVYQIVAGTIAMSAAHNFGLQAIPVVWSTIMTWLVFADFGIRRPLSPAQLGIPLVTCFTPFGRSFVAMVGMMFVSVAPRVILRSLGRGHVAWWGLLVGLVIFVLAGSLAVYAANAHADDAWQAAQERAEDSAALPS